MVRCKMEFTITTNKNENKRKLNTVCASYVRMSLCKLFSFFFLSILCTVVSFIDSFECWTIWLLHKIVVCITESKANIKHIWISCTLDLPIFISLGATTTTTITNTDEWTKQNEKNTKSKKWKNTTKLK